MKNELLKRFLAEHKTNYDIHKPGKVGDKFYYTDGRICIEVSDTDATEFAEKFPSVQYMFACERDGTSKKDFAAGEKACKKYEYSPCPHCGGTGGSECKYCRGEGEGEGKTKPCRFCNATGKTYDDTPICDGFVIDGRYISLIMELSNPMLYVPKTINDHKTPVFFMFDGGRGLIMPKVI